MKRAGALEKAFQVLQVLAEQPQQPLSLGAIADRLSLHRATCVHILKKLTEMHYAEQVGPRMGYRLGPMAYYLTRKGPYRQDLVAVAEPVMGALAQAVGETVILVTLSHGTRLTLCSVGGSGEVRVDESVMMDANAYVTATGRLLLAHSPRHELETYVAVHGLPGDDWPEARDWPSLVACLAEVRRGEGCLELPRTDVTGVGCVVRDGHRVVAALGLYLPIFRFKGGHRSDILRRMPVAAEEIGAALTRQFGSAAASSSTTSPRPDRRKKEERDEPEA
ncbi:MAG: helix-turn-helix domain-containing protein [Phycisphaerae bacterium]|nr:helix-turn-helix domain-containing protein [Phycisphaerae bacterium]